MISFQAGQLWKLLGKYRADGFTGVVQINVAVAPAMRQRSRVLAMANGYLTFVDKALPTPSEFAALTQQKLNISHVDSALKVSASRVKNQNSIRELFEFISRFGLFKWDDLERVMQHSAVLHLEQILPYGGTCQTDTETEFDLSYGDERQGFDWQNLEQDLGQRQRLWSALSPSVAGPDTIPLPTAADMTQISDAEHRHFAQWVDGQRSLSDIAGEVNFDPLEVAKIFLEWSQYGWVEFKAAQPTGALEPPIATPAKVADPKNCTPNAPITAPAAPDSSLDRPIILSVDDSPIVQTMIKRAIGDRYQVIAANNAVGALNLLNAHPVKLLLLDVTMPDIDGLELCRTIRSIAKFRNLPVVMLTAKDGLIDKVKGQFAGSTHYLIKPIDREKLLPVLEKYIPVALPV